jgi:hypothetical protein
MWVLTSVLSSDTVFGCIHVITVLRCTDVVSFMRERQKIALLVIDSWKQVKETKTESVVIIVMNCTTQCISWTV